MLDIPSSRLGNIRCGALTLPMEQPIIDGIILIHGGRSKILLHFIQIDQKQYRDMLGFMSALNTQTLKAKYKRFKTMRGTPEANPRGWWKFAIQSVMWENEKRRNNRGWKQVMQFKQQRAEYITLYKRK